MNRVACDGVSSFHFDFHKNLACPKLTCQDFYYRIKLTTYAFGMFSGETKQDTVYIWPETVGPKNPDTVVSCLDYHFRRAKIENGSIAGVTTQGMCMAFCHIQNLVKVLPGE